jgi:hypothetical protein
MSKLFTFSQKNCGLWLLIFLSPLLLTSCVTLTGVVADDPAKVYFPGEEENLLARFAPLFVLQTYKENYNRIGRPSARFVKKETRQEDIFIDPAEAAMFVEQRTFSTAEGNYINLIYRIHFA